MESPRDVTLLLQSATAGEPGAVRDLFAAVYDDLRRRARAHLSRERPDHTLQPTALVHEAFMRLVDQDRAVWQNRAHFLAVAAQAMRRILVDHARARNSLKRPGGKVHLDLDESLVLGDEAADPVVIALDEALRRLEQIEPAVAQVVELRFFGGLSVEETAAALGVSEPTVKRAWRRARDFLQRELGDDDAA